jgi:tetratricopeptide (TPR) repeat protein
MKRLLRPLCLSVLGLTLAWATPSPAQSFEGLDLAQPSKKKKSSRGKKPAKGKKPTASQPAEDDSDADDTSAATPAPSKTGTATSSSGMGLDLSAPSSASGNQGMGLDLTSDAAPKAAPTMSFDTLDVSGKSGDRQRLDVAISLFKNEEYEKAAMSAFEMLEDPKLAGLHLEARYVMAKSLYRIGLYHSSLGEFSKILAVGPETKFFRTSLEWLFFISRKTKNESVILDEIARHANQEFPERFRSEFHYLLARYHFVRGKALDQVGRGQDADKSFNEVKRLALLIPKTDVFYPRVKYLEGLAYFRFGNRARSADERRKDLNTLGAIEAMKEVVRLTRSMSGLDAEQASHNQKLRELAFMQLARTHYGMQQNRYAIFYFGKVERGTSQWLEARQPDYALLALLPRGVPARGPHPQGGHLLRELPLPRVLPHPPGLRAHLPARA